jgi:hypothetical protein
VIIVQQDWNYLELKFCKFINNTGVTTLIFIIKLTLNFVQQLCSIFRHFGSK